jgi:hypothetical protein
MAEKLHTHYDNLKVAQDAPLEVIRAAYKVLAQKHHPDRNPGEVAERVMKMLNESWDVLSDPAQRAAHDAWISEQIAVGQLHFRGGEQPPHMPVAGGAPESTVSSGRRERRRRKTKRTGSSRLLGLLGSAAVLLTVSAVCVAVLTALSDGEAKGRPTKSAESLPRAVPLAPLQKSSTSKPDIRPVALSTPVAVPVVADDRLRAERRQRALLEFGQNLPHATGPIVGARQTNGAGHSTVTIENANVGSPVVAKLCHAVWLHCWPLHHVYIEPGASVTLKNLSPGKYDVRHVNLDSGAIFRSALFEVMEANGAHGIRASAVRLKLLEPADSQSAATRIELHQF